MRWRCTRFGDDGEEHWANVADASVGETGPNNDWGSWRSTNNRRREAGGAIAASVASVAHEECAWNCVVDEEQNLNAIAVDLVACDVKHGNARGNWQDHSYHEPGKWLRIGKLQMMDDAGLDDYLEAGGKSDTGR